MSVDEHYGEGARKHPPHLTWSERRRFTRTYYQLWGLMRLSATEWQLRLENMRLKQLYLLREMCRLTQSIGREEVVPPPEYPNAAPGSINAINSGRSQERIALSEMIWEQIERTQSIHDQPAEYPWALTKHEGYLWFIVMWDHWQSSLEDIICVPRSGKQYLWDDSSDEESCPWLRQ